MVPPADLRGLKVQSRLSGKKSFDEGKKKNSNSFF